MASELKYLQTAWHAENQMLPLLLLWRLLASILRFLACSCPALSLGSVSKVKKAQIQRVL